MTKEQSLRKRAEEIFGWVYNTVDRDGEIEDFKREEVKGHIEKALLQTREEAIREAAYIAGGSAGNDILALLNGAKKTKEGKKA